MNKALKVAIPAVIAGFCSFGVSANDFTTVTAGYIAHSSDSLDENKNQFDRTLLTVANVRAKDWGRIVTVGIFENLEQSSSDPQGEVFGEAWSTFKFAGAAHIKTGFVPGLNYMVDEFFFTNTNGYENNMKLGLSYDMKFGDAKANIGAGANYVSIDNAGAKFTGFSGYALNATLQYPISDKWAVKFLYNGVFERDEEHAVGYTDSLDGKQHDSGYRLDLALNYHFNKSISAGITLRQLDSWFGYKSGKADMMVLTTSITF
ncbi:hypothetical protein JK628_03115 [Shewanella sp. KX20019]|uniref:hypothetical protein n=1 Tax=Shewanella sp. KX20019 TaxID=2803864 RepID=UPI0019263250|nr:hypothetical protein [Shewanella sp. KX20019]QQX80881.1 hypothetical protein JK628_03115 [Shewanella sp. KX20019]